MQPFAISQGLYSLLVEGDKQSVKAGQRLQPSKQYPSLCLVSSGYVKRFLVSPAGAHSIQSIYGPGDIFPLTPIFKLLFNQEIYEGPMKYHYGAMTDVELFSIDNKQLVEALEQDQELYKDLLAQAGRRLQSNIQQLENAGLKDPLRRVSHQLAFLARQFGIMNSDGITIPLPLTAQDMADLLDLTVREATQSLRQLHKDKLIEGETQLTVPDIAALLHVAYS